VKINAATDSSMHRMTDAVGMTNTVPSLPLDLDRYAILLDVDGTIVDIAPTPDAVRAPQSLRRTLRRLLERTGGAIALVSGRPLESLDRIFAPLLLPAVGGHGAEMRPAVDETAHRLPAKLDPALRRQILTIAKVGPGVMVEDKGYSMALHYRTAPEHEDAIKGAIAAIRGRLPSGLIEVLPGKSVIEVKAAGFNKGTALRELMRYPNFAGRRPIFIGDDTTDEAAFAVMPEFRGVPICVGCEVAGIPNRFETPGDVRRWLARVANDDGADSR
jgi:trehalose 6-phosphate phosphatase